MSIMTEQEKRIGNHPSPPDIFAEWLIHEDLPASVIKKHRVLLERDGKRLLAVEQIAHWIIDHHIEEETVRFLQQEKVNIYRKYAFDEYVKGYFTVNETTQKGNLGEVLVSEYLKKSSGLLMFIFRLRYNQNADQSLKGDDMILFDGNDLKSRVMICESKFRKIPDHASVEEILESVGGEVRFPISVHFISQRMRKLGQVKLANELAELAIDLRNKKTPMINVGFLLSNQNAANHVEGHHLHANFKLTDMAISELDLVGFPTKDLFGLKGRNFKTESNLLDAIKKILIKAKVKDAGDLISIHKDLIYKHCDKSTNPELVFVTLGLKDPEVFVRDCFQRAHEILVNDVNTLLPISWTYSLL